MKLCRSARKRNFGLRMGRLLRRLSLRSRVFSSIFWRPYKKAGLPDRRAGDRSREPQTASFPAENKEIWFPSFLCDGFPV